MRALAGMSESYILLEMPGLGLILKLVEVCLVMDGGDLLAGEASSAGCV